MKRLGFTLGLTVLAVSSLVSTAQTETSDPNLQTVLESTRRRAMAAWQDKDASVLKQIMAADFQFQGPQGVVQRDEWLASLSHCSLKSYRLEQPHSHVMGDVATLTYDLHYVGDCDGVPVTPEAQVTDTFSRRDGKWWIVRTSFTPSSAVTSKEAQATFDQLKSLAGSWQGTVATSDPKMGDRSHLQVSLRVTSRGNALVHEMKEADTPDDPTKYDHPVTMLYLDDGRLLLTHYCDAGNRPRMVSKTSADGKTVEFTFLDLAGPTTYGHMDHASFTIVDANHHMEDWTYLMPGDKPMHAHMDLHRQN